VQVCAPQRESAHGTPNCAPRSTGCPCNNQQDKQALVLANNTSRPGNDKQDKEQATSFKAFDATVFEVTETPINESRILNLDLSQKGFRRLYFTRGSSPYLPSIATARFVRTYFSHKLHVRFMQCGHAFIELAKLLYLCLGGYNREAPIQRSNLRIRYIAY